MYRLVGIYFCALLCSFEAEALIGILSSGKSSHLLHISPTLLFSLDEASNPKDAVSPSIQRRPVQRPIRRPSTVAQDRRERQERAIQRSERAGNDPSLLSDVRWDELPDLAPASLRAVTEVWGWQRLTEVQAQTWPHAVAGKNILARARTGTGKTMAYLLPAIQCLLETDVQLFRPGRNIGILVMAPTRELVVQIAQQASVLASFHHAWTVQALYGGGSIQRDRAILYHRPLPTILVATPGRLHDLLRESCRVSGNRLLVNVMGECRIVVLDETDRLLHGFSWEMNKLLSYLPRVDKRQTMLFSATIPAKLKSSLLSGERGDILPSDFVMIDCEHEVDRNFNQRVQQHCIQLSDMKQYVPGLYSVVHHVMTDPNHPQYKAIIFLPTAKLVKFFADLFAIFSVSVLSIHSRMSQGSRQRASTLFRQSTTRCVLLSSDVSARGVDYPDVDLVVQYGAPLSDELYLHRLGRTGRAGQVGCGLVVLLPFESRLKSRWKRLVENNVQFAYFNTSNIDVENKIVALQSYVRGGHPILLPSAEAACVSFVVHYLEYGYDKRNGTAVLDAADQLVASLGLASLPSLPNDIQAKLRK